MKISVVPTAQQAQGIDFSGKTVIVIDVLRATSVITTALYNGALDVVTVKTVEEADSLAANRNAQPILRGGERNAVRIAGFDFGNSPLEYTPETVGGKHLIITTTNGTQAIQNVKSASEVVMACFRNAAAVVDAIVTAYFALNDVAIVCAGTEGQFSLDDGLCAGMIIELLKQRVEVVTDDLGLLLSRDYRAHRHDLLAALSECFHLRRLSALGFDGDIRYCLETNCVATVPVLRNNKIMSMQYGKE